MTNKQLITKLKQAQARIAKERDALRDLLDDWEALKEDCQEAYYDIERAVESLSKLQ